MIPNAAREDRRPPVGYPILIIDDHELFSTSLRMALHSQGFDARQVPVARVAGAPSIRCPAGSGLVVLDLDLGRDAEGRWVHGADLVHGLREAGWQVLIVSGSADDPGTAAAIAGGAIGAVSKSSSFEALLETVATAAAGEPVMSEAGRREWQLRHAGYQERERELSKRLSRLSARERDVLELLAEGHRAAAIADRFVVSLTTVRTQIRAILTKLDVNSQLEAVAMLHQLPRR